LYVPLAGNATAILDRRADDAPLTCPGRPSAARHSFPRQPLAGRFSDGI